MPAQANSKNFISCAVITGASVLISTTVQHCTLHSRLFGAVQTCDYCDVGLYAAQRQYSLKFAVTTCICHQCR